ncbi:MAG TPA: preprotein translocase subunit SecA [Verrucomicrobiales bacterium]|nr:preprotein translocase subunit SecA [Verrucomicrobiales bacterium]
MIGKLLKKIVGSKNDRAIRKFQPTIDRINEVEESFQTLSDDELRAKVIDWKGELSAVSDDEQLKTELEQILPKAFAAVKNAARRLCGTDVMVRGRALEWEMIHFDVQLIGGIALHNGKITEMATGEGKTLVATLPVFLNALTGRGVHVVTVNDYLAARDSEWMGAVYTFLGLKVGCIQHDQSPAVRKEQYDCDITYGTNSEFGFDYLRDNGMATRKEDQVQRGYNFAIVDEVDSILIDEARTPLIISGPTVINIDNQYDKLQPPIEALVKNQLRLCSRYLTDAEKLIKNNQSDETGSSEESFDREREIGLLLYKARNGGPRNPSLLKLLEDPANVKIMNTAELDLLADQTKKALYAEKEELFFAIDEKAHDADLTEKGRQFLSPKDPEAFVLPDITVRLHEIDQKFTDPRQRAEEKGKVQAEFEQKAQKIHSISQLLKAYCLYQQDVQYIIQNGKVVIVDENTGRLMPGRRWSDGLHQAVEAKEGVEMERETQTLATITIQNYFRLYHKLAGMTGTAETEASEFLDIYSLGVLVIPTNRPNQRSDWDDTVYKTRREKFKEVVREIKEVNKEGRPMLVGTISVETSELLSRMLKKEGIIHSVLNARYHEQEAEIIARAGQRGAVTIATNMAGRGTDIKLGKGVADLGGLHVMGTERHEARRIDRQLRGRCARQGDPGSSHFYISLEDDLMRLFGSDKLIKVMERVGLEEGQELSHPLLNRSIGQAQKKVESHNFQIRKRTLEYDDVRNKHREVLYGFRNDIIQSDNVHDRLLEVIHESVIGKVVEMVPDADSKDEEWNVRSIYDWVNLNFPVGVDDEALLAADTPEGEVSSGDPDSPYAGLSSAQIGVAQYILKKIEEAYELKASLEEPDALKSLERYIMLTAIDKLWQEHLYNMDSLRDSIGLRAYGQRDPLLEYKSEAYKLFQGLMDSINLEICHNVFRSATSLMAFEQFVQKLPRKTVHQSSTAFDGPGPGTKESDVVSEAAKALSKPSPKRSGPKVGRNAPCPCGSGRKYKQCCGKTGNVGA